MMERYVNMLGQILVRRKKMLLHTYERRKKDGWMVILWTNRTGKHLKEAVEWCHKKDIHLDAVNENPAHTKLWIQMSGIEESQKIFADEYLDNKKLYVLYFRS